ncbi:MAG: hypothetical protein N3B10_06035 [Armatimonadetes bacterium]|nr:hypothetical protein [Armatimonadota bacterium]
MTKQTSAEFVRRKIFFRRLKMALRKFASNYGLKPVAWSEHGATNKTHVTGFNQWLMTSKISAEFIRRKFFPACGKERLGFIGWRSFLIRR